VFPIFAAKQNRPWPADAADGHGHERGHDHDERLVSNVAQESRGGMALDPEFWV
jgi:hypothetical protein